MDQIPKGLAVEQDKEKVKFALHFCIPTHYTTYFSYKEAVFSKVTFVAAIQKILLIHSLLKNTATLLMGLSGYFKKPHWKTRQQNTIKEQLLALGYGM